MQAVEYELGKSSAWWLIRESLLLTSLLTGLDTCLPLREAPRVEQTPSGSRGLAAQWSGGKECAIKVKTCELSRGKSTEGESPNPPTPRQLVKGSRIVWGISGEVVVGPVVLHMTVMCGTL